MMQYNLTGNFQYDLGVYGLKKILDFFKEDYRTDGNFYIEVDKKPEEILELIFLYKFYQQKNKFAPLFKDIGIDINSLKIYESFEYMERDVKYFSKIKEKFFQTLALSFHNEFFNLINPSKKGGIKTFEDIIKIIFDNVRNYYSEKSICSFCNKNEGSPINKMYFFLSPPHLNAFWQNKVSIYICEYCVLTSLSVIGGLIYFRDKKGEVDLKNSIFIYKPNLEDLENLNNNKLMSNIGEVVSKVVEYEKLKLKESGFIDELQIIEIFINPQNPNVEFYYLTEDIVQKLIMLERKFNLDKFFKKYKDKLWGKVKDKKDYETIDLAKEFINMILSNQKIILLIHKYIKLSLMANNFRQKEREGKIRKNKIPIQGFFIDVFLQFLKAHFILEEDLDMDTYEAFKEYGQFLRGRVFSSLSEGGEINWNTFNNKIISLSNSFLDASKGTFNQFMETLTRVMISYDAPIDSNLLQMITKDTYKDIATTIALAVMTKKPGENSEVEHEENTKGISL